MDRPLPARCTTTNSRTRQRKTKTDTIPLSPRLSTRSRISKVVAAKSTAINKRKIGSSGGCGAKIRKTLQGSDVAGDTSPIPRSDFHPMFELMQDLAKQVSRTHVLVAALFCDDGNVVQESVKQIKSSMGNDEAASSVVARIPNEVASTEPECNGTTVASSVIARTPTPHQEPPATKLHETISSKANGSGQKPAKSTKRRAKEPTQKIVKNKPAKQRRATRKSPKFVDPTSVPLTHEEKEKVVEAINSMSSQETQSIVQLIRESAKIDGNDDEIELDIDALDTATQRQLLWFVSSRRKKPKKGKTQQRNTKRSDKNSNRVPSDEEVPKSRCGQMETAKEPASASASCAPETNIISNNPKPFTFAVFKMLENDDSDEDDNDMLESKWNLSSTKNNVDAGVANVQAGRQHYYDEDEWDAARNEAALAQIRQAQQEAYKAKLEQTQKQKQRASASAFRQQYKTIDNDIYRQEKQQKAEAEAARAATREQVNAVQQTIDLDEQRDIMRELGLYRDDISVGSSEFEYKF